TARRRLANSKCPKWTLEDGRPGRGGIRRRGPDRAARRRLRRGPVWLPDALERQAPAATTDGRWQGAFPPCTIPLAPRTGWRRRHPRREGTVSRAVSPAGRRARLPKRPTAPSLRHALARHRLEAGYDLRTDQEWLGHAEGSATMIDTPVRNKGGKGA